MLEHPTHRGRGQRPRPAGERVRARPGQAARGVPARLDAGRHPAAVRDVQQVRRRHRAVHARCGAGFAGITVTSLLLFVVLMLPVLWTLVDRLRRAQQNREVLLQRAVEASDEERRRIAATLHDGVVQELAASSFALAGAAERAERSERPRAGRAAAGGRRDRAREHQGPALAAGRHLPGEPADRGPGSGADGPGRRAGRARRRRPARAPRRTAIGRSAVEQERLVYRVVQETLRNAVAHAHASQVVVQPHAASAARSSWRSRTTVSGFDVPTVLADAARGTLRSAAARRPRGVVGCAPRGAARHPAAGAGGG